MNVVKEVPINSMVKFTSSLFISTIKLFNCIPTKTQKKKNPTQKICEETIDHGWIFSQQVAGNYTDKELRGMVDVISTEIGLTPAQMNFTFNKSWRKVRDAPYGQLLAEQIFHYMTTYGYEAMGSYSENTVFIPNERLDIPAIGDGVKLAVIRGYTKSQLKEKLLKLINSGITLDNIEDIFTIAKWVELSDKEVIELKNKEVRTKLYSHLDLIPENPTELLRLAVYETTDKTLLINNRGTIELIKGNEQGAEMDKLFKQYDEHFGLKRLAQIYKRFKPLFLSFKSHDGMIPIINKISHLSNKYHRPMGSDMLNNITAMLKKGEPVTKAKLNPELDRVNIWRKIRLAQSLKYRISGNKSMLYKIRNGKAFATTMEFDASDKAQKVYDIIIDSIAGDMKHLRGKEFYIPENLVYSLPSTAKQFSGNIPTGSYVKVGKDMIFGIWWQNVDVKGKETQTVDEFGIHSGFNGVRYDRNDIHNGKHRIDLDLHAMAQSAGHIGWNTTQRSGNRSLLRTGDITDAPDGAVELFYINKDYEDTVLFTLNYYNYNPDVPVPYKLMVADEHPNAFGSHYTIDPNNMKCLISSVIDKNQITLGLGTVKDGECRFYFSENSLGNSNVVKGSEYINIARDYMSNFFKNAITFNEVIEKVGAKIVHTETKKSIDLSPENLQKDTFTQLLIK